MMKLKINIRVKNILGLMNMGVQVTVFSSGTHLTCSLPAHNLPVKAGREAHSLS